MFKKIPKKFILSLIFYLGSMLLVTIENKKQEQKILGIQTQLKADQQTIAAWEQILEERPNYRDGWIQLAAAYYKIGDKQKAKEALQKAKELDPTNEVVLNFEKLIGD
jgi:cytochrome c-type biogenesis protein CcmH/NrfG